jgi:hypothetical protein
VRVTFRNALGYPRSCQCRARSGPFDGAQSLAGLSPHPSLPALKTSRKLAQHIAVERYEMGDCGAVYDRKQEQSIFGLLPKRFSLLDQLSCPLSGGFCFRRSIAFDMHEGSNEGDLKANLFATQHRRAVQCCDLGKRAGELPGGFFECRSSE